MFRQVLMEWVVRRRWKKMEVSEDYRVDSYLERIVGYFDPSKALDRKLTVVYEFHDSGVNDGSWTVSIAGGKCVLSKGAAEQYDTLLYMTADTYRRILNGRLDFARLLYATGAVRFFGNTLGHRELNSYLTLPKNAGIAAL